MDLPYLDAATLSAAISWPETIDALGDALAAGLDVGAGPARTSVPTAHGDLLLMPAESAGAVGVKLIGLAPGNAALGLPLVQGVFVLFDARTLTPRLLIDGTALTTRRTPAVSALAIRALAPPDAATLTVFGSGPQAQAHVQAVQAVRPLRAVTVVGRDPGRADRLVERLRAGGTAATTAGPEAVRGADVVVCATTAGTPLFDPELLSAHACVVAVGSHTPQARELHEQVFARADRVVVEDRATALREAGDVVHAVAAGGLDPGQLVALADLPRLSPVSGITVFKSVGMGWQDLAVAEAVAAALDRSA